MPNTNATFGRVGGKLRYYCAKHICKYVGKSVNIEHGAVFGKELSIGDKSGIGVDCVLSGNVTIGKYVNMGPQVYIYIQQTMVMIEQIFQCKNKGTQSQDQLSLMMTYGLEAELQFYPVYMLERGQLLELLRL